MRYIVVQARKIPPRNNKIKCSISQFHTYQSEDTLLSSSCSLKKYQYCKHFSSSTYTLSSSKSDPSHLSNNLKRESKAQLRELRNGTNASSKKANHIKHKDVDYRYRKISSVSPITTTSSSESGEQMEKRIQSLWGDGDEKGIKHLNNDVEKQKSLSNRNIHMGSKEQKVSSRVKRQTFKSLFEEVDEIMDSQKSHNGPIHDLSRVFQKSMKTDTNDDNNPNRRHSLDSLFGIIQQQGKEVQSKQNFDFDTKSKNNESETITLEEKPKSIFEAFPLTSKVKNPNAYEKNVFDQYDDMMTTIINSERFEKKHMSSPRGREIVKAVTDWLLKDERVLDYSYDELQGAVTNGILMEEKNDNAIASSSTSTKTKTKSNRLFRNEVHIPGSQAEKFFQQIEDQQSKFMSKLGFTNVQYEIATRAFDILSSHCARSARSSPLSIAWEKMKEAGIIPATETINTCLYVTGTMASSGLIGRNSTGRSGDLNAVMNILGDVGGQTNESNSLEKHVSNERSDVIDLPTELAIFHDLLFEPTEKSISLRVKRLVSQGDATTAEFLLDSFPSSDDAKLRTYLPVLKLYCEQGDVSSALKLFKMMRNEPKVRLEPENYVLLIATLAENGCFRSNAVDIEGAKELGYNHSSGPLLFDELMMEMSEDVLEITSASARRLYNAFATGFQEHSNLQPIHSLGGLATENIEARPDELIASRVTVGETTATCPRSGVKLNLIKLEDHQRTQLQNSLLQLSTNSFEEFAQNNRIDTDYAAQQLNKFADWLDTREGKPFTAIVDGANVAYYMQNFEGGMFNFHQINFMVEALQKMNENPLVIIPYKYSMPTFMVTMGTKRRKHKRDKKEQEILDKLITSGKLYVAPPRCLDDYYWMLASVSDQTNSRNGENLDVLSDNKEGRWPGTRPMLVSNDLMRDHKLGLLEPRLFRRWFSCFIVNYNFTAFVGKESVDREIGFSTADFFSREIQCSHRNNASVWHIPVSDWKLDDRLCLSLPKQVN